MYTIRRYPGLKCEKFGSDEFELDVILKLPSESVEGRESYPVELRLCCAHCPRVIPVCGLKSADGFSELLGQISAINSPERERRYSMKNNRKQLKVEWLQGYSAWVCRYGNIESKSRVSPENCFTNELKRLEKAGIDTSKFSKRPLIIPKGRIIRESEVK